MLGASISHVTIPLYSETAFAASKGDGTVTITGGDAEAIASAAQAFGQNDDITVLTLRRAKAGRTVEQRGSVLGNPFPA
ncbi:MAG TPA: hypothetical protein VMI06_00265 [Terriglobia bacterium]|nr:hypothetical protein [Terriglobia bacterium]